MIRVFVSESMLLFAYFRERKLILSYMADALNEGNPGLNLGEETIDNLEGAFRRVREVVLSEFRLGSSGFFCPLTSLSHPSCPFPPCAWSSPHLPSPSSTKQLAGGQKYLRLIRFELIRLYQLQSDLRSLSYFDILGRLRLTLALTRVTLEIPMVLDRAMREEVVVRRPMGEAVSTEAEEGGEQGEDGEEWTGNGEAGELQRRGLLGPRIKGVLVLACRVLEKGERFGL